MFLLSGGTRIDENDFLERSENNTDLIACTEEQRPKFSILIKKDIYNSKKSLLT